MLIHCFAGAHRAGTTGVAWLMHAERLSAADALRVAQRCRPIIDPKSYAELYSLLLMLQQAPLEEDAVPAQRTTGESVGDE